MENFYLKLKELVNSPELKNCKGLCRECPLSKEIISTDYKDYDICDLLELIRKYG